MVRCVRDTNRKSVIVFCIDIEHCEHVAQELRKYGVDAGIVTGSTTWKERERLVEDFKDGKIHYLLSVNVFFEGFNAKAVDCVAMLRPTQSKGLWVQAVGRGLRLHPQKDYCLVLDYGDNITRHGPIDLDDDTDVKTTTCEACGNVFSRAVKACPSCGWIIPPVKREAWESAEKAERKMHEAKAARGMLLNEPKWMDVDGVTLRLHRKAGKPDSVRIEYHCGLTLVKEWLLLEYEGYGSTKARKWLSERGLPMYESAAEMLESPHAKKYLQHVTKRLMVRFEGKYLKIAATEIKTLSGDLKII
jgi:DNA repair protein RadD